MRRYNIQSSLIFILVLVPLLTFCHKKDYSQDNKPPNIIFILADDLGYMDVGAYAEHMIGVGQENQFYETPNIDKLVNNGVAFSQAYATQLCSPSRAAILTGKNPARFGFTTATGGRAETFYNQGETPPSGYHEQDSYWYDDLNMEQAVLNGYTRIALPSGQPQDHGENAATIAELLKGYSSAFIGKWHLGGHGSKGYQPRNQGFEEIAYFDGGGSPYFDWENIWDRTDKIYPQMRQPVLLRGKSGKLTGEEYLTDDLTQQALNYLDNKTESGKPFFLYFNHFAVHSPLQAPDETIQYFESKSTRGWNGHQNSTYAAMVKKLDNSVGKIIKKLEETGLAENTLIVFMSDNGGISWDDHKPGGPTTSNAPLRGGKAMLYEGGIRVPLAFYWKDHIEGGKWINHPVGATDIYPTLIEAAGYNNVNKGDGQSLMSFLGVESGTGYTRNTFYWHYPFNVGVKSLVDGLPLTPHSAIRKGDYKLIFDWYGRLSLYNISGDITETNDISNKMPDKTRELFGDLITFLENNVEKKYWPKPNPEYNPEHEKRDIPYVNLYKKYKEGKDILNYTN